MEKYKLACEEIDEVHLSDPNFEQINEEKIPAEYVYSQHMINRLESFYPQADESLLLSARCQHFKRWEIPRDKYPMDKTGYYKWRNELYEYQGIEAAKVLKTVGYDDNFIDEVKKLIGKRELKTFPKSQLLEDVVCLVFIEHYFEPFAQKHDPAKLNHIVVKTWHKMSEKAQNEALKIHFSDNVKQIIIGAIG